MFDVQEVLTRHYPAVTQKPLLFKSASFVLRHLLHEREVQEFGATYPHLQGLDFVEQVLDYFHTSYSVRDVEKERIPAQGRVVIIANHPIGSLDALALIKLISEVRRDIKVVANEMLMAIEPLHSMLLPVNVFQGGTARNHLMAINQHLEADGALIIFPAGEVSRLRPQGVRDTRWRSGFLRIAKEANADIVPVFIDAKNSPLFYGVSMLHKPLATLLLVREMFKRKQRHLPMRIGEAVPVESWHGGVSFKQQAKLFKRHLYAIGQDKKAVFQTQAPIALPEDRQALRQAIKQQCEQLGQTVDGKDILLYQHTQSSAIMREIGRLREIAFRAVGEGSHKRRDIDHYDNDYYHLILWDRDDMEIVGAYRFGDARKQIADKGLAGLYSASLFNYTDMPAEYFEQGLELGRSFVQPKYWGKRSLEYLWYGIGAFLRSRPHYRYLFGPVSLSNSYPKAAKDLLVYFYQLHFGCRHAFAEPKAAYTLPDGLQDVFNGEDYNADFVTLKHLLANMGVAVPTLFKQYTELCEPGGAQFLSFSIDADFADCVDGLVMVDITKVKAKKRNRYLEP